ncbi:MAG: hypothetical protein IIC87_00375 [Chloroflexi bacterium]|nr:hypothetical protein [Chloroflexota bacterium]
MPLVVGFGICVYLHQLYVGVVKLLRHSVGGDKDTGVGVLSHEGPVPSWW